MGTITTRRLRTKIWVVPVTMRPAPAALSTSGLAVSMVVLGHGQRYIAILDGNLQVTGLLRLDDEIRSQLGDFIRERTA